MYQYKFRDITLPIDERVNALLKELTLDEKLTLITYKQQAVPRLGLDACKLGTEAARGLVCRCEPTDEFQFEQAQSTVFPEPFGLASSFDPDIMHEMGVVTGKEARIYHRDGRSSLFLWAPTVDLERDPRWGRNEEGYGEDPLLSGTMTAALTKGMYGSDHKHACVIPTMKHFYANNHEENRTRDSSTVPAQLKYDYYLKAFEEPIKNGGAKCVMTAYGEVNGVEGMCNPDVSKLKDIGLLFSLTDAWDFVENVICHKRDICHTEALARTYKNRAADIITDEPEVVEPAARDALERGLITEADIDNALFGVLKARFLLGEFDDDCTYDKLPQNLLCCDEHLKSAARAAEESIILLRNKHGILPLDPSERYSIIGFHADMNLRDWYTGLSDKTPTILDGITALIGRENLKYESGNDIIALRNAQNGFYFRVTEDGTLVCDVALINEQCLLELFEWGGNAVSLRSTYNGKFLCDVGVMKCVSDMPYGWEVKEKFFIEQRGSEIVLKNHRGSFLEISGDRKLVVSDSVKPQKNSFFNPELFSSGIDKICRAVTETQNAIVFLGNNPLIGAREKFDRKNLQLPERQRRIAEEVLKLKKNAVFVIVSGFPYSVGEEFGTLLHTSHAGPAMGAAVARTLFGKVSPAGRCPMTWYSSENELGDIKDYNIIRTESTYRYYNGEPLFPFGFGLTYTAFKYGAPRLNKNTFSSGERIEVTFEVNNFGMCDSDEVVQLYVKAPRFSTAIPKKELKAFRRIHVAKGMTTTVKLAFDADDLAFWDTNTNSRKLWSGTYELQIGASSEDIRHNTEIEIHGEEYAGLDVTRTVSAAASWRYVGMELQTSKELEEYALLEDGYSSITFENCRLNGETHIEIVASNPRTTTTLVIRGADNGIEYASVKIPQTGGLVSFVSVTADVAMPTGMHDLTFSAANMLSFKLFRFYK